MRVYQNPLQKKKLSGEKNDRLVIAVGRIGNPTSQYGCPSPFAILQSGFWADYLSDLRKRRPGRRRFSFGAEKYRGIDTSSRLCG